MLNEHVKFLAAAKLALHKSKTLIANLKRRAKQDQELIARQREFNRRAIKELRDIKAPHFSVP